MISSSSGGQFENTVVVSVSPGIGIVDYLTYLLIPFKLFSETIPLSCLHVQCRWSFIKNCIVIEEVLLYQKLYMQTVK